MTPGKALFTEILDMKLQDPANLPNLLHYAAQYLKYMPSGATSETPQVQGCVKILEAAEERLKECAQSSEQHQAKSS